MHGLIAAHGIEHALYSGPLRQDSKMGSVKVRFAFLGEHIPYTFVVRAVEMFAMGAFVVHISSPCHTVTSRKYMAAGVW